MSQEEIKDRPLRVCVLTVSDTRTVETDKGGNTVIQFLARAGVYLPAYTLGK